MLLQSRKQAKSPPTAALAYPHSIRILNGKNSLRSIEFTKSMSPLKLYRIKQLAVFNGFFIVRVPSRKLSGFDADVRIQCIERSRDVVEIEKCLKRYCAFLLKLFGLLLFILFFTQSALGGSYSFFFFAQAARLLLFSLNEKSKQKNQVSLILVFSLW